MVPKWRLGLASKDLNGELEKRSTIGTEVGGRRGHAWWMLQQLRSVRSARPGQVRSGQSVVLRSGTRAARTVSQGLP